MKTKRFWKKAIIILFVIAFAGVGVKCWADVIYNNFMIRNDEELMISYKVKKEKHELLKSIPNDFIEEEKGISFQQIPDNIRYEIKNQSDGNIQFYYYIEPESSSDSNPYKAWITLSKDYKVIEEKYGVTELDDFETFKQNQIKIDWFGAYMFSFGSLCIVVLVGTLIAMLLFYIQDNKKKKSQS